MTNAESQNNQQKLDVALQRVLQQYESGQEFDPSQIFMSGDSGELLLEIIAKLENPDVEVPGLETRTQAGKMVTGTISLENLRQVLENENVHSLSAASIIAQSASSPVENSSKGDNVMEPRKDDSNEPTPFNQDDFVAELLSGEYRMRFNESFQLVITWHPDDETAETKQYVLGQEPVEGGGLGQGQDEYIKCVKNCVDNGGDQTLCAIYCIPKLAK